MPSWVESWQDEELDDNAGAGALAQGPLTEVAEPTVSPYLIDDLREKAFGLNAPSWRPEGTGWFKALRPPPVRHCVLFVELVPWYTYLGKEMGFAFYKLLLGCGRTAEDAKLNMPNHSSDVLRSLHLD